MLNLNLMRRDEDGARLPATVWRPGRALRTISSATLGGGLGTAEWVVNAQVPTAYARTDPAEHLRELAALFGLAGPGVGMLTAAAVDRTFHGADGGVGAAATVGLRVPTWAAAPAGTADPELAPLRPGTVNILVSVPVPLTDAALVNAVMTVTEAKTQALLEAGYACTGTASDAVCVAAPLPGDHAEPFAGPRSPWGARIARAVHTAVRAGAEDYTAYLRVRRSSG
ncbi:adenosylcobinamide amidohydrolase [Actinomadura atramentaria]|uniref:adenosylcobinamide amidohydrolase n=1 Tax=Actinomadura atramentaria TaxID=1990 RepID=UPI00037D5ED1|nr:adenosylcobinamide amidohydrolase [Actinomadura atramentaria]